MNEFQKAFFYQLEQGRISNAISDTPQDNQWLHDFKSLNFLQSFLDQEFEELIFHGPSKVQVIANEKRVLLEIQTIEYWNMHLIFLALLADQPWNTKNPQISFRFSIFKSELRMTLVHGICFSDQTPRLFIRKIKKDELTLEHFTKNEKQKNKLIELIQTKENIIICGATGSGKTSLLNTLLEFSNSNDHLISIEDTEEIFTRGSCHSKLLATNHSMQDFCHYALRMNPDRLIVGEIRSSEVIPLVLCMNTGHKGVASTLHANSATDAIDRLATLFQLYHPNSLPIHFLYKLLCNGIGYVIFVNNKQVHSVIKVLGHRNDQLIYEFLNEFQETSLKTAVF